MRWAYPADRSGNLRHVPASRWHTCGSARKSRFPGGGRAQLATHEGQRWARFPRLPPLFCAEHGRDHALRRSVPDGNCLGEGKSVVDLSLIHISFISSTARRSC